MLIVSEVTWGVVSREFLCKVRSRLMSLDPRPHGDNFHDKRDTLSRMWSVIINCEVYGVVAIY